MVATVMASLFLEDAKLPPKSGKTWRAPFLPLLTLGAGAKAAILSVAGTEKKKRNGAFFFSHMCSFMWHMAHVFVKKKKKKRPSNLYNFWSRRAALMTKTAAVLAGGAGRTFVVGVASLPLLLSRGGVSMEARNTYRVLCFRPSHFLLYKCYATNESFYF